MRLAAKFASICPVCGEPINVGDDIEWEPGKKAVHPECAGDKPAGATQAPPAPDEPDDDLSDAVYKIGDVIRRKDTGETMNVVGIARDMIEGKDILYRISHQPPGRPWYAGDPVVTADKLEPADLSLPDQDGEPPEEMEDNNDIDLPEANAEEIQEQPEKPKKKEAAPPSDTEQRPLGLDAWI